MSKSELSEGCLHRKGKDLPMKANSDCHRASSAWHLPRAPGRCGFPLAVSALWIAVLKMIKKCSGQPWKARLGKGGWGGKISLSRSDSILLKGLWDDWGQGWQTVTDRSISRFGKGHFICRFLCSCSLLALVLELQSWDIAGRSASPKTTWPYWKP